MAQSSVRVSRDVLVGFHNPGRFRMFVHAEIPRVSAYQVSHLVSKEHSSMKGSKRVSKQALEGANVGLQTSATRSHSEPDAVTIHSECAAYPPLPSTSTTRNKFCLIHHRSILHHGPVQSPSPAFSVDRQLCLIPRVREVEFVTKQLVIDLGAKKT